MTIVFVTTQTLAGSTIVGRILPLALELKKHAGIILYVMKGQADEQPAGVTVKTVGQEPFIRTASGKVRLASWRLALRLLATAWQTFTRLLADKPDVIVIVKPLPPNILAVALARLFYAPSNIILDSDDFEVAANVLTSIWQRAVIHASERLAGHLAHALVAATPFLQDHLRYLTNKEVALIPTGISPIPAPSEGHSAQLLYAGSVSLASGHSLDIIIPALKILLAAYPNLQLHVAGSGDDIEKLKRQAARQQVASHIAWHGRFTPESLTQLLTDATILLDPVDSSVVARAKSSYRCMLALAAGLPVVTGNIGIRSRLIPHELHNRLFVQATTPPGYAQTIAGLVAKPFEPFEKQAMRQASRAFHWDVLAKQYWDILKA